MGCSGHRNVPSSNLTHHRGASFELVVEKLGGLARDFIDSAFFLRELELLALRVYQGYLLPFQQRYAGRDGALDVLEGDTEGDAIASELEAAGVQVHD